MAVLAATVAVRRLRPAVRMIEILAVGLRVVDLALGIAAPRGDVASRAGRLVQDRAAASRERIPTVAHSRRRYPLPFPQAHPPPGLIWMNERGSGYRGARRQQSGNAAGPPDGLLDRPRERPVEGLDNVGNRRSCCGLLPQDGMLSHDLPVRNFDQLQREGDRD